MKRRSGLHSGLFLAFILVSTANLQAQRKKKSESPPKPEQEKKYSFAEVNDSLAGIAVYNRLVASLLGDSVRLLKNGDKVQGWKEDYYQSGKLLHKGFYKDGKLDLFRNYFENGKTERVLATIDSVQTNMEVFYENGNQRRQINYVKGQVKRFSEFYENGLLKTTEEYDLSTGLLAKRKIWLPGGQLQNELALSDPKNKKYTQKIYHANGKLAESGALIYKSDQKDFFRTGVWMLQDSTGKKKNKTFTLPK